MSSRRTVAGTPSRQTRTQSRANTPQAAPVLPAVNTAPIHSYGSRGKVTLKHQVATENTDLAEVFEENRRRHHSEPVSEEDEDIESQSEADEPQDDGVLPGDRNGTVVGSTIIYDNAARPPPNRQSPTGIRLRGRGPRSDPIREQDPPFPSGFNESDGAGWPSWFSVFFLAFPRYLWRNLWALLLGGIILSVMLLMPLPNFLDSRRENLVHGARVAGGWRGWEQPPKELELRWQQFKYNATILLHDLPKIEDPKLQAMINALAMDRISEVQEELIWLQGKVNQIEGYLPPRMIVDLVNGQMVIKQEFWNALNEKFLGSSTAFESFVAANEVAAERLIGGIASNQIDGLLSKEVVISRAKAVQMLESQHKATLANVSRDLQVFKHEILSDSRTIAAQAATEIVVNSLPAAHDQLAVLAKSRFLQNMVDSLQMVNHFNYKSGARVDPHGSSPSTSTPKSAFQAVRDYLHFSYTPKYPQISALEGWSEEGDCFCAADSDNKGKAQLTVLLGEAITPSSITVDHIPARGTRGIAAAPRDFEFWVETDSPATAASTREQLTEAFEAYNQQTCASATPPSPNSVCVGQGRYDIHGANWVQTFPLFTDLSKIGLTAKKVVFRATSNWGADYTCLYRLRLSAHDNLDE